MIDLQIHTTATPHHSFWQPQALAQAAAQAGLSTIAATDHNTMANVRALLEAGQNYGVRVIPGVELDSGFGGKLWHTLVYGVTPENLELLELCEAVFQRNLRDAAALRENLAGAGFRLDTLETNRPPNVADVATALARENLLSDRIAGEPDESAGMRYLLSELVGSYRPLGVDEIIAVAHRNNGIVVLAHPGRSKGVYAIPATEADIAAMVDAGIDGIEVYYPAHTLEQRAMYLHLARKYQLLISAGSDSHGPQDTLVGFEESLLRIAPNAPTILEVIPARY